MRKKCIAEQERAMWHIVTEVDAERLARQRLKHSAPSQSLLFISQKGRNEKCSDALKGKVQ